MTSFFIKRTQDGRKVEVIDGALCLEGRPEGSILIPVIEHPNQAAIRVAVPDAVFMVGRLPLSQEEADRVKAALSTFVNPDPQAIEERLRQTVLARERFEAL